MKKSIMTVRGEPDETTSHSTKLASEQVAGYVEPHSNTTGEELWREKKARAGLAGRDTADAEGVADFGCLFGSEVIAAKSSCCPRLF